MPYIGHGIAVCGLLGRFMAYCMSATLFPLPPFPLFFPSMGPCVPFCYNALSTPKHRLSAVSCSLDQPAFGLPLTSLWVLMHQVSCPPSGHCLLSDAFQGSTDTVLWANGVSDSLRKKETHRRQHDNTLSSSPNHHVCASTPFHRAPSFPPGPKWGMSLHAAPLSWRSLPSHVISVSDRPVCAFFPVAASPPLRGEAAGYAAATPHDAEHAPSCLPSGVLGQARQRERDAAARHHTQPRRAAPLSTHRLENASRHFSDDDDTPTTDATTCARRPRRSLFLSGPARFPPPLMRRPNRP